MNTPGRRPGITLLEVLIATVVIAVALALLVSVLPSGAHSNASGELSSARLLRERIAFLDALTSSALPTADSTVAFTGTPEHFAFRGHCPEVVGVPRPCSLTVRIASDQDRWFLDVLGIPLAAPRVLAGRGRAWFVYLASAEGADRWTASWPASPLRPLAVALAIADQTSDTLIFRVGPAQ